MALDVNVSTAGRYSVAEVGGEIDVTTASQLRDMLHKTIDAGGRRLVVDLRRVGFIDSAGLGVLVGVRRRLLGHGQEGSMELVCGEALVRIIRLTGLDRMFPLHATLTAALGGEHPAPGSL
jgi:anti-sigma B factor antagonist